jgi:hypothetical protein
MARSPVWDASTSACLLVGASGLDSLHSHLYFLFEHDGQFYCHRADLEGRNHQPVDHSLGLRFRRLGIEGNSETDYSPELRGH